MPNGNTLRITGVAALALAGQLLAGGFYLQLGNPEASAEARKLNAVLTVKVAGCGNPTDARLTAAATGFVNGQRRTIPVKLTALREPGFYAITQQWPDTGPWVVRLTAREGNAVTATLVSAGPKGVDRYSAKSDMRAPTEEDVDAMLRN